MPQCGQRLFRVTFEFTLSKTQCDWRKIEPVTMKANFIHFWCVKTDRKWMLLLNNCSKTVSGHFFAICIFIFHKTEVRTVILRCLTGLNCNWLKSYGLRCSRRPRASSVNFWKITHFENMTAGFPLMYQNLLRYFTPFSGMKI